MTLRSLAFAALLGSAAALPAAATDITNMTDAEKDAFGAAVRAYVMENPALIIEAYEAFQAQEAAAKQAAQQELVKAHEAEIYNDGFSWVGGNPDGDVTVVEFADYRCGYCRKAHPEVEALIKDDGNIRHIVKEIPIISPQSPAYARFAIAALIVGGDEAYHEARNLLMSFQGDMTPDAVAELAGKLGLNAADVAGTMQGDDVTERLEATLALARDLQISGTPAFIIGEELVGGYVALPGMKAIVAEARAAK